MIEVVLLEYVVVIGVFPDYLPPHVSGKVVHDVVAYADVRIASEGH